MNKLVWVVGGLAVLWIIFGHPLNSIAELFWSNSGAPWEKVNAFYYPDKGDLTRDERRLDVGTLNDCRDWVRAAAQTHGDFSMERGDYECGIGCRSVDAGMYVCRLTIR